MGTGKTRATRKLRTWIVEQVNSGKFRGLVWDDEAKTMFRIPWKHAGKQDFRSDEDAAIFKAWAEFKGKLSEEEGRQEGPASWKTRLRCALNKSLEFEVVSERSQLDISEPYKVYRLVPTNEQGLGVPKSRMDSKKRPRRRESTDSSEEVEVLGKQLKKEVDMSLLMEEPAQQFVVPQATETVKLEGMDEIQLDVRIETTPLPSVMDEFQFDFRIETNPPLSSVEEDSFRVVVSYSGHEVVTRDVQGTDVRLVYHAPLPEPPTPASFMGGFPRIAFPEPPEGLDVPLFNDLVKLLPCMERGVLLTSTPTGVYAKRFCQGRVFWVGPHSPTSELHKIERNSEPVLLFSKEAFRQQLEAYQHYGGEAPGCDVSLCFGEELHSTDDPSKKLIVVKITFPWAEKQVQNVNAILDPISILQVLTGQSGDIMITLVPMLED